MVAQHRLVKGVQKTLSFWTPLNITKIIPSLYLAMSTKTRGNNVYRTAVGVALAAALLLVCMHLAVATEDDSPGLLLFGVLVVGIIGAIIARFRPHGMARALFATALVQALVAVIAMIAWEQYFEVLILNGFFIALWVGSALLFRRAASKHN